MNNLQENLTVTYILEQVVDVNILNFKGVDPQTELTLFTGSSNVVIDETCLVDFFLGDFFKTVSSIKDLSNKNSVDLWVSFNPILGSDHLSNIDSLW